MNDRNRVGRARLASTWHVVDGYRMHARESTLAVPDGRTPVVLVHGLGVSSRYMIPTAEALAPHVRTAAPDLPGFGRSTKPPHTLDVPELVDALAGWMEAAGIGRAVLVGNSFGCQLIVELARRHPDRITHAVLVGPTVDPAARSTVRHAARAARDLMHEPPSLYPILAYDYLVAGVGRFWRTFRYLLADPVEEKLPEVRVPALVVRGEHDAIVPQRWAEETAYLLPDARLVVVEGAAHAVNFSSPEALAQLVRTFMEE